jgi:hypothetical protein
MAVPSSSIRALVAEAFSPMDDRNLEIILMMAHRMVQKNAKRSAAK